MNFIKKINSTSIYLFSRYFIYGIQFLNSLLIALYLGPFYLGIWGFFNLMLQYTEQINFGIANASNVFLSIAKQKRNYNSFLVGNSLILITLFTFLIIFILFFVFYVFDIGIQYNVKMFFIPIVLITFTTYINSLMLNIMRVYDRLNLIVMAQAFYPILTLTVLIFIKKELLLESLVYSYLFSNLLLTAVFFYFNPINIRYNINKSVSYIILNKAIPLFLYNCFFYLIMISTRTSISLNYDITEFGIFTFTFSLSNIVLLLFESITFLIWPKLINRFSSASPTEADSLLTKVRKAYLVSSHVLMYIALICYPIFILFFDKYQGSYKAFGFNLLAVMILNASFGFQPYIISKSKQKFLSYLSMICFVLNLILSTIIIYIFKCSYEYVILATLISYLIFAVGSGFYTYGLINKENKLKIFASVFPYKIFIPFTLIFLVLTLGFSAAYLIFIIFSLFLFLNYDKIFIMKDVVIKILKQPNFFKI